MEHGAARTAKSARAIIKQRYIIHNVKHSQADIDSGECEQVSYHKAAQSGEKKGRGGRGERGKEEMGRRGEERNGEEKRGVKREGKMC